MTTIEKVSESTRYITHEYGTVIEAITTLWEDGIYTVYVEYDREYPYSKSRCFHDPLIDNATEPPTDDDIIGAWETAQGW